MDDEIIKPRASSRKKISDDDDDNLNSILYTIIGTIKWKMAGLLIVVILFMNTSIFAERVLAKWSGAVKFGQLTEKGILVQTLLIALVFIVLDLLVSNSIV